MKDLLQIVFAAVLLVAAYMLGSQKHTDPAPAAAQPVIIVQPAQQQPAAQSSIPVNVGDLSAQQPVQPVVSGTNTPGPTLNEYMGLPEGGNPFAGQP